MVNRVAGNLALDFANTAAGRETPTPIEHLAAAGDLAAWAADAGVTARQVRVSPRLLAAALGLREAIFRIGAAIAHNTTPGRADLAGVKNVAAKSVSAASLAPTDGQFRLDFSATPAEAALLGPIAWSALDLLASGRLDRVKQCAGPGCGWLYLDTSKNGARRWCDMATCGNRTKARRHRLRTP